MKKTAILLLLALLGSTAHAQNYTMEFESGPDFRLPAMLDSAMPSFRVRFDLNGDGRPEIVLQRVDDEGNPVELFVVDPEDLDIEAGVIWTLAFKDLSVGLGSGVVSLMGFFDINADGVKAAIFRSPGALALIAADFRPIGDKHSADDPFVLPAEQAAVLDIDNDGFLELIIQNPETNTVQVWGGGSTGTATEDDIARALLHLAQSYPNPFRQSTTINYTVEQTALVTLDIYDLLGRRIRRLVEAAQQGPGPHRAVWDGRDNSGTPVSSGTYFYRLRVGDAVTSKQAIRVK